MARTSRLLPLTALVATIVLAACGTQAPEEAAPEPTTTLAPDPTVPPGRGWLGAEPDMSTAMEADRSATAGAAPMSAGGGDMASSSYASTTAAITGAGDRPARASLAGGDLGAPPPTSGSATTRAGSVDDNADVPRFLAYLDRVTSAGIPTRPFDARGRIAVTVLGPDGATAAGVEVTVAAGSRTLATLRTGANGTARFLPGLAGAAAEASFTFSASGAEPATSGRDGSVTLRLSQPAPPVRDVDVMFVLDATGSMGDEISQLSTSIDQVSTRVRELPGAGNVRFGLTVYRDQGDAFVTGTFDLTDDMTAFRTELAKVVANGGGDTPEALDEALDDALRLPQWRPAGTATQIVVLVADAAPHVERQVRRAYPDSVVDAMARGIAILPIGASSTDDSAEVVFRQMAFATGTRFVFLSYGAAGAATGGSSDISPTDYEEMPLDDLVVRLIDEQLAARDHRAPTPITPAPTTTSIPDGQQQPGR